MAFLIILLWLGIANAAVIGNYDNYDNDDVYWQKIEEKLEDMERRIVALELENIQDDNILLELTDAVYQQDDKLMKIEQENAILNATFSKLQAELREGGDHAANELLNPEPQTKTMKQTERAARLDSRQKRQVNPAEGPVAFTASLKPQCKGSTGTRTNQILSFGTSITNLGGAYNPTTGQFTVPRDGVYMFASSILASSNTNLNIVHVSIAVNGKIQAKMLAVSEILQHRDQGANTAILDLKRGDIVWAKAIDHTAICTISSLSTFTGTLLYAY